MGSQYKFWGHAVDRLNEGSGLSLAQWCSSIGGSSRIEIGGGKFAVDVDAVSIASPASCVWPRFRRRKPQSRPSLRPDSRPESGVNVPAMVSWNARSRTLRSSRPAVIAGSAVSEPNSPARLGKATRYGRRFEVDSIISAPAASGAVKMVCQMEDRIPV